MVVVCVEVTEEEQFRPRALVFNVNDVCEGVRPCPENRTL